MINTHELVGESEGIAEKYEPFTSTDMVRIQEQLENFFPIEMGLLRQAGVHPTDNSPLRVNPYTGEIDNEAYNNIGQHCMAVGYASSLIASLIFPSDSERIQLATSHGITHNLSKGLEIMRKKAAKAGKFTTDPYAVSAYEMVGQVLAGKEYPPEFIDYLKKSGQETGHTSLIGFLEMRNGEAKLIPGREIDKIVHVADDITWTAKAAIDGLAPTFYLPIERRAAAQDFPHSYPFLYVEGIGFDSQGGPTIVKNVEQARADPNFQIVNTYAEWQVWEAREMSYELVNWISTELGERFGNQSHDYIVEKLNDHMRDRHNYFPHLPRTTVTR